ILELLEQVLLTKTRQFGKSGGRTVAIGAVAGNAHCRLGFASLAITGSQRQGREGHGKDKDKAIYTFHHRYSVFYIRYNKVSCASQSRGIIYQSPANLKRPRQSYPL